MKARWRIGQGSVAEVREEHTRIYGSDLAYTTVMTLLGRLAKKKVVSVQKKTQPFVYAPVYRRESVIQARLQKFVDTVFDGEPESLVMQLVETSELTAEDLERIQALLSSKAEIDES